MSHAKNKVKWCLKKAEKEGHKHRGLVKGKPNTQKALGHVTKADHNLKATLYLHDGGYTDWCSSTLFYTIYHCFLGILVKYGYESRNQECTFALIESFIEDRLIDITKEELENVSVLNEDEHAPTIVDIREEYQYATKLSLSDDTFENMLRLAQEILDKTKVMIEE